MSPGLGVAWRYVTLGGVVAGLALAPIAPPLDPPAWLLPAAVTALALARPRGTPALAWLAAVALAAGVAGVALGDARLEAADARALIVREDERLTARGTAVSTPRVANGVMRFVLAVDGRRIGVETAPVAGIDEGRLILVRGTARAPAPWEDAALRRAGAAMVVAARTVRPTATVRSGLRGALDGIRRRAEAALQRGTPDSSAALLRGFVLGQDDRIPEPVRDQFRRSGLAHVLAVSGQNVMLLALLAAPLLALAGVPHRARLAALVALIAIYVPVAGAGPSIQRAGVMGAAGLVAALASRPRARWYALLLAAVVTLALDPRATGDIGWQLSFGAVAGLLVLAAPLARVLGGTEPTPMRRLLAEGAAMTLAATLATAPLAAHHFGTVSLTAVPANLLALPAIAPAMWMGMLAGAIGQIPGAPVEPITVLGGLCAGFIGWVAGALGGASAQVEIEEPGLLMSLVVAGLAIGGARLLVRAAERRTALPISAGRSARRTALAALALLAAVRLAGGAPSGAVDPVGRGEPALRIRVLDVGQGDSILLEPRRAQSILVDAGPPGGTAAERLAELGIERLGAVVITHDDLDHSGGLPDVLSRVAVGRLIFARDGVPRACGRIRCPPPTPVSAGQTLGAGRMELDVLWPPVAAASATELNARSLVLRARLGRFDALLAGDAEAEIAPVVPGAVDLLKVAHHGSADAGLPALLARSSPELAVISVGADNGYGHPTPATLGALREAGVPVLRTDEDGEVVIEVAVDGWGVG